MGDKVAPSGLMGQFDDECISTFSRTGNTLLFSNAEHQCTATRQATLHTDDIDIIIYFSSMVSYVSYPFLSRGIAGLDLQVTLPSTVVPMIFSTKDVHKLFHKALDASTIPGL